MYCLRKIGSNRQGAGYGERKKSKRESCVAYSKIKITTVHVLNDSQGKSSAFMNIKR